MVTNDIPAILIGVLLLGLLMWALYNHTHPEPRPK
jgi:hypothetical protein